MNAKTKSEYDAFDDAMRKILQVPHAEIKKKLDEEKAAKRAKRVKRNGNR